MQRGRSRRWTNVCSDAGTYAKAWFTAKIARGILGNVAACRFVQQTFPDVTVSSIRSLREPAKLALVNPAIRTFLVKQCDLGQEGGMQWQQLKSLRYQAVHLLADPGVLRFLADQGHVDIAQLGNLSDRAGDLLRDDIERGFLSERCRLGQEDGVSWHTLDVMADAIETFNVDARVALIEDFGFNPANVEGWERLVLGWSSGCLNDPDQRRFMREHLHLGQPDGIQISELEDLDRSGWALLSKQDCAAFLLKYCRLGQEDGLNLEQLRHLVEDGSIVLLFDSGVRSFLTQYARLGQDGGMGWEELSQLSDGIIRLLCNQGSRALLVEYYRLGQGGEVNWTELGQLSDKSVDLLCDEGACAFLMDHAGLGRASGMAIGALDKLNQHFVRCLLDRRIRAYFIRHKVAFNDRRLSRLMVGDIRGLLAQADSDLGDFDDYWRRRRSRIQRTIRSGVDLNEGQSAHNDPVEQSSKNSINALLSKYGQRFGLKNDLREVNETVASIVWEGDEDSFWPTVDGMDPLDIKQIASESLERLAGAYWCKHYKTFGESDACCLTVPALVRLMAEAIESATREDHPFPQDAVESVGLEEMQRQARIALAKGLYRVHRAYRLEKKTDIDIGGESTPSCLGGHYSLLVSSMQGSLEDCVVAYVTMQTMYAALPVMFASCLMDDQQRTVVSQAVREAEDGDVLIGKLVEVLMSPLSRLLREDFGEAVNGFDNFMDREFEGYCYIAAEMIIDPDEDCSIELRHACDYLQELKEDDYLADQLAAPKSPRTDRRMRRTASSQLHASFPHRIVSRSVSPRARVLGGGGEK